MKGTSFGRTALAILLAAGAAAPLMAQGSSGYILGPDDQIEVSVYGQPDLTVKTRIKADGEITLPLVGDVAASGETVQSLADKVEQKLRSGGIVKQPIVNIEVQAYVNRAVTVLGAVASPGLYGLDRPQTLTTLLARAGGVRGDGSERVVLRRGGGASVTELEIASLARDGGKDVAMQPGDVVFVPIAEQFYVYGQVNSPGSYPIIGDMTVRQALARGGGPTLAGTERRVTLYRAGKNGVEADLESPVRKGDVLFVKERLF
jgi:polysaccharide biosynthesis/export protein